GQWQVEPGPERGPAGRALRPPRGRQPPARPPGRADERPGRPPLVPRRPRPTLSINPQRGGPSMISVANGPDKASKNDLALRFQNLKAQIHRQLVEGLDISRLHQIKPDRLRREVRNLAVHLSQNAPEMINELERERLVDEIMDEAFGLGPLEGPMKDPT